MNNYLRDTEYATKELFKAIKSEQTYLENLRNDIITRKSQLEHMKSDYATYQQMDDYDDMKVQHKFI